MLTLYLALTESESDGRKFEKIYNLYKRMMLSAAYKILGDASLSEDCVHEAFIRILKNLSKLDEPESPRTRGFVMIVTENVAKSMYRKRGRVEVIELDDELAKPQNNSGNVDDRLNAEYIASLVARLPESLRQVLLLKILHELSDAEISTALGISNSAVRKRLQRAREQLRQLLGGDFFG